MSNASALKKPTLKTLAAAIRRLEARLEDMEDLIELRAAVKRNALSKNFQKHLEFYNAH